MANRDFFYFVRLSIVALALTSLAQANPPAQKERFVSRLEKGLRCDSSYVKVCVLMHYLIDFRRNALSLPDTECTPFIPSKYQPLIFSAELALTAYEEPAFHERTCRVLIEVIQFFDQYYKKYKNILSYDSKGHMEPFETIGQIKPFGEKDEEVVAAIKNIEQEVASEESYCSIM